MRFRKSNNSIYIVMLILTGSIGYDIFNLVKYHTLNTYLGNYFAFEKTSIEWDEQILLKQIDNSIAFKAPNRRDRLLFLSGFECSSLEQLEEQILVMHPSTSTLDSLPFDNDDIQTYRQRMNKAKNKDIATFYADLLRIAMLETLNSDVYDDSDCGFYGLGWKIFRPISSDSTYIGSLFYADRRSKYAYQINGKYFDNFQNATVFTVPKSDTLNIYTILMRNHGIRIDTQFNNQRIKFDGMKWREI